MPKWSEVDACPRTGHLLLRSVRTLRETMFPVVLIGPRSKLTETRFEQKTRILRHVTCMRYGLFSGAHLNYFSSVAQSRAQDVMQRGGGTLTERESSAV